jgi:hypothetical protein
MQRCNGRALPLSSPGPLLTLSCQGTGALLASPSPGHAFLPPPLPTTAIRATVGQDTGRAAPLPAFNRNGSMNLWQRLLFVFTASSHDELVLQLQYANVERASCVANLASALSSLRKNDHSCSVSANRSVRRSKSWSPLSHQIHFCAGSATNT